MNIYESIWDDFIYRNMGDDIKLEDDITDEERKILSQMITVYRMLCRSKSTRYVRNLNGFVTYVTSVYKNSHRIIYFDLNNMVSYVKRNWNEGDQIRKQLFDINECDAVSPNGGAVFGDIGGMGEISFPGPDGEPGSGDLPMPSGKVYRQVTPFSSFIKIKKKKKKKFNKKDEPCAQYDNPPIYD